MVTEKSCKLRERGSGTSSASSVEHLPKKYLQKKLKLATFRRQAKGSREAEVKDQQSYRSYSSVSNISK